MLYTYIVVYLSLYVVLVRLSLYVVCVILLVINLYCMLYVISFVACTCIVCCNFVYSGMEERLCRMPEFKYINQIKSNQSIYL